MKPISSDNPSYAALIELLLKNNLLTVNEARAAVGITGNFPNGELTWVEFARKRSQDIS